MDDTLETCEILYSLDKTSMVNHTLQFYAETNGVDGRRRIAESKKFRGMIDANDQNATRALNGVVEKLKKDGWQEAGRGQDWYNIRFRKSHNLLT